MQTMSMDSLFYVGLEEGESVYRENCLCVTVLCTIIMVHKDTSSSVSGFDLAWFSSLIFRAPLCLRALLCLRSSWCYIYILEFFSLTSFSLPFSELSLVGLPLDVVD